MIGHQEKQRDMPPHPEVIELYRIQNRLRQRWDLLMLFAFSRNPGRCGSERVRRAQPSAGRRDAIAPGILDKSSLL